MERGRYSIGAKNSIHKSAWPTWRPGCALIDSTSSLWARFLVSYEFVTQLSEYVSGKFRCIGGEDVIRHLYEQITRSLVRIYLGLDRHTANLYVWVVLKFSDPIKALIEGRMEEQRGMEEGASSASFSLSITPQPSFSIWPNINFTPFSPSVCVLSLFSSPWCLFLFLVQ